MRCFMLSYRDFEILGKENLAKCKWIRPDRAGRWQFPPLPTLPRITKATEHPPYGEGHDWSSSTTSLPVISYACYVHTSISPLTWCFCPTNRVAPWGFLVNSHNVSAFIIPSSVTLNTMASHAMLSLLQNKKGAKCDFRRNQLTWEKQVLLRVRFFFVYIMQRYTGFVFKEVP